MCLSEGRLGACPVPERKVEDGLVRRKGLERRQKQRLRKRYFRALEAGREPPQAALELGAELLLKRGHPWLHSQGQMPGANARQRPNCRTLDTSAASRRFESAAVQASIPPSLLTPMTGTAPGDLMGTNFRGDAPGIVVQEAFLLESLDTLNSQGQPVQKRDSPISLRFPPPSQPFADRWSRAANHFVQRAPQVPSIDASGTQSRHAGNNLPPPPAIAPPIQMTEMKRSFAPAPPHFNPASMTWCAVQDVQRVGENVRVPMVMVGAVPSLTKEKKRSGSDIYRENMHMQEDMHSNSSDRVVVGLQSNGGFDAAAAWTPAFVVPCHVKNTFIEVEDSQEDLDDDQDRRNGCTLAHAHRAKSVPAGHW